MVQAVKKSIIFAIGGIILLVFGNVSYAEGIEDTAAVEEQQPAALTDISSHWAKREIEAAVAAGYVTGFEDQTFRPEAKVTKEQFLAMAARALELSYETADGGEWFAPILQAAKTNGLYKDDYTGSLKGAISRREMALTLERATHKQAKANALADVLKSDLDIQQHIRYSYPLLEKDIAVLKSYNIEGIDLRDFSDLDAQLDKISDWYNKLQEEKFIPENEKQGRVYCSPAADDWYIEEYKCVNENELKIFPVYERYTNFIWMLDFKKMRLTGDVNRIYAKIPNNAKQMVFEAVSRGIIGGTKPGELSLEADATRAQAVVMIERMLAYNAGERLPVNEYSLSAAEIYWHHTNLFSKLPQLFNRGEMNFEEGDRTPSEDWDYWYGKPVERAKDSYKAYLDELIVVDYNDPKDPYRHLLPDTSKNVQLLGKPLNSNVQAYVLIPKVRVTTTQSWKYLNVHVRGNFNSTDASNGVFNQPAIAEYQRSVSCSALEACKTKTVTESTGVIFIPKAIQFASGDVSARLYLELIAPGASGYDYVTRSLARSTFLNPNYATK